MKKSLVISDSEKYGENSPAVALSEKKPEDRKSAPTIELTGKQVDAFCACGLNVGDKGSATIHFIVKASSAGDQYGNEVPKKDSKKKVNLSITHVDSGEIDENESAEGESDEEDASEGEEGEASEESAETPETSAKKPVSVADTGLDE